MGEIIVGTRL